MVTVIPTAQIVTCTQYRSNALPSCYDIFKNSPHILLCLNTKSQVGGSVLEQSGGVVLLEEACHWEWALRFLKTLPFPACSLLPLDQGMCSLLLLHASHQDGNGLLALWNCKVQINPCFYRLHWPWCFIKRIKSN